MAGNTYALFTALYHPHLGGVESYMGNLAHELVARGERVLVVTLRLSRNHAVHEMQPDGVEVFRLPCLPLMADRLPMPLHNAEHAALLDGIARANPDRIVLNNHFYAHTLDGARFARRIGAQAVVIEHGSAYLTLGNAAADAAVRAYEHAMASRVKSFGFPFVGVSSKVCDWVKTFGIETVGVVPNAIDADAWRASARPASFRSELGLDDGDMLVAFVGRLVPEKGVEALLEAARIVREHSATSLGTDAKCLFALAGDGPLLQAARFAGDNVVALGRLDSAGVAALLRDCDAYVLPSRSEGFATSLLEAAASGAFIATTDVGGVDELGIGSLGGVVLPDSSSASIVAALETASTCRDACEAGADRLRERVNSQCTWAETANELDAAFQGETLAAESRMPDGGEVFEGDERLDQLHRVLLMMMKDFAAICERENITWIAHYGTAIGALRHKGFIPWDDDIDICMMRADLDRFVAAVQADGSGKYSIVNAQTHEGYPLATTRFILNGTEFRDSALATMDFPSGIFLDLFPLDALSDDECAYQCQVVGSWFFNKLATAKLTRNPYIAASGALGTAMGAAATAARVVLNAPGIRMLDPNTVSYRQLVKYNGQSTQRVGYTCDTGPYGCIYRVDDLLPVRWVPFEDMMIPVPNHVEEQLTEYYGDWMTPPPGDQRKAHYPDILDFGEYGEVW